MAQQSFGYGTKVKLNASTFVKNGKEFDHWNTMANDTGESYSAEQEVTFSRENFTLFAQWKDATNTLSIVSAKFSGGMRRPLFKGTRAYAHKYTPASRGSRSTLTIHI